MTDAEQVETERANFGGNHSTPWPMSCYFLHNQMENSYEEPALTGTSDRTRSGIYFPVYAVRLWGGAWRCSNNQMENKGSLSHNCFENNSFGNSNGEQCLKRRKILEQKKVTHQLIDVACAQEDHLLAFPSFCKYSRGGLSLYLQSGRGDKLSYSVKKHIQNLLKINMEGPYGSQWPTEEKVKHREMVSTQARYIFVHEASNADANGMLSKSDAEKTIAIDKNDPMVAFVHFRFIIEEMIPVLYVYELQIEPCFRGRGLGTFLMELIELIACKTSMGAVVFTVQKANSKALNFYRRKLRYTISTISPSRVNPSLAIETSYEILCKAFNKEAKAILEGDMNTNATGVNL